MEIRVPLTAVEHAVLRDELDVVPEVVRRMREMMDDRFVPALHAPRIDADPNAPLVISRTALAVTVAVLLEADAEWAARVRGLVAGVTEAIDRAAVAAAVFAPPGGAEGRRDPEVLPLIDRTRELA
ncbi:MAG: hypothetical protein JNM10_13690 [Planctomycetia bacterium]|nr:hypothetical protein [Planctomycetia bacterium]